jgi:hypothetical protein
MELDAPIDYRIDRVTGDIVDPPELVSGIDAVEQGIWIRLQMIRGEWFANLRRGLPYLPRPAVSVFGGELPAITARDSILGGKFDPVRHRRQIRELVLSAPGVRSVLSLSVVFDSESRALQIAVRVNTVYGPSGVVST